MADGLGTPGPPGGPGVVSAVDHRLDQAGMIAPQTSTLAVRTGVLAGPGWTTLVTGTSATGTMTVNVAAHHWVSTRGTADGVYLGTKEASTTVTISAAPGSNSRIDVIYVKQNDQYSSISPDATSAEVYDKATGTAAVSPTKPAIPTGAIELATVTVAAGATSTNGAGVTIANTARPTVARGARVPVRTQAERDALTTYPGHPGVWRIDLDAPEDYSGGSWQTPLYATPAAQDIAYVGTWGNYGTTLGKVRSHLEPGGFVSVYGDARSSISEGTAVSGSGIGFLATGHRPLRKVAFYNVGCDKGTTHAIEVGTDGAVIVAPVPASNAALDMSVIRFQIANT